MTKLEILSVCEYILTHPPKDTRIATIDAAIRFVTKDCCACTHEEMLGDDAWMLPPEEVGKFAGIKPIENGRAWQEGFIKEDIDLIERCVDYALAHAQELQQKFYAEKIESQGYTNDNYNDLNSKEEYLRFVEEIRNRK